MMGTSEKKPFSDIFSIQMSESVDQHSQVNNFSQESYAVSEISCHSDDSYRGNNDDLAHNRYPSANNRNIDKTPPSSLRLDDILKTTTNSNSLIDKKCQLKWKWLVFAASFFGILYSAGFLYCLTVLFVELLEEFQKSKAETSLVQAVGFGFFLCSGFIAGVLVSKFGEQKCMLFGTLLSTFGIGISYFAVNIPYLVCTIGVIGGSGFSLCYIASCSIVPAYFTGRWRFLALGFLSLSSGVGQLLLPILLNFLIQIYHWRGALLIMSGINLNMLVSTFIIVKPQSNTKDLATKHMKKPKGRTELKSKDVQQEREPRNPSNQSHNFSPTLISRFRKLAKNNTYVGFTIAMMISFSSGNNIIIFFIDLFESKGIQRDTGVWLYTALGLASTLIRPFPGYLAQLPRVPKLAIPAVHILIGAVAIILFPYATSVTHFAVLSCSFGMSIGGLVSVLSISTLHIVGEDDYPTALGVLMSSIGIMTSVAGPMSGFLRDVTGIYDYSFFAVGACLFLSFLILVSVLFCSSDQYRSNMIEVVIEVRRKSRRHSSLLPWRKSLDVTIIENTKL